MDTELENGTAEAIMAAKTPQEAMAEASKIINRRTLYAAGLGLIPFPGVEAALIVSVQLWMIRDIAATYDIPFKKNLVSSAITTLVGNLGVIGGLKLIPGLGTVVGGFTTSLAAGAATYALGKVFTMHFNQGGTLLDFDPISSRAYFQEAYKEGKLFVSDLQEKEGKKTSKLKGVWNKWTKRSTQKEFDNETSTTLTSLEEANEQLRVTVAKLQKDMAVLKASAKG